MTRSCRLQTLRRGKHDHVIPGIVEKGIADTNLDERVAHQVQSVIGIRLVIEPPIDNTLSVEGRVTAIDVLTGVRRDITGSGDALCHIRAVGASMTK